MTSHFSEDLGHTITTRRKFYHNRPMRATRKIKEIQLPLYFILNLVATIRRRLSTNMVMAWGKTFLSRFLFRPEIVNRLFRRKASFPFLETFYKTSFYFSRFIKRLKYTGSQIQFASMKSMRPNRKSMTFGLSRQSIYAMIHQNEN